MVWEIYEAWEISVQANLLLEAPMKYNFLKKKSNIPLSIRNNFQILNSIV